MTLEVCPELKNVENPCSSCISVVVHNSLGEVKTILYTVKTIGGLD